MSYFLFLLVNAVLFIRPSELMPSLAAVPIYEMLIIGCALVALPRLTSQMTLASLQTRPISVCVLGVLFFIPLSLVLGLYSYPSMAFGAMLDFSKVAIYYFLLVGVVDSTRKLQGFLAFLMVLVAITSGIVLLQYFGAINIPALVPVQDKEFDKLSGGVVIEDRYRSTGIFNDPNDLAMVLVLGSVLSTYSLLHPRLRFLAPVSLTALGTFLFVLSLTKSRGGLLAMLAGVCAVGVGRYGWRKAAPLAALALPGLLAVFAGRMTDISGALENDTGQGRLDLWYQGLQAFMQSPLFGTGFGTYTDVAVQVAHNTFVHEFVELGFVGGAMFLTAFFCPLYCFIKLGLKKTEFADPELNRLRPYLLAALVAYGTSMMSLSRGYVVPTYLILGIMTVYFQLAAKDRPVPGMVIDQTFMVRAGMASVGFLVSIQIFLRLLLR